MSKTIEEAARLFAEKKCEDMRPDYEWEREQEIYYLAENCNEFAKEMLASQWRSVEEELPEQCSTVVCVNANADPHCKWCWLSFYVGETFQDNADSKATFPTHWLPIPSLKPEQR